MVAEDDETSKDKEIDKLMALISLSFKKIYKPTNNNLRTSSNTSPTKQDNSPRINRSAGYENQRNGNVAGVRENVGSSVVSPDAADSGPIFDDELLQKVSTDDHYNVFALESFHPEQSKPMHDTYPIEQDAQNVIIDSLDMSYDREEIDQNDDDNDLAKERELLASLIEKLKCEIDESKNHNKFLETSNKVLIEKLKAPDSDEVIRLEKESRSKLSDLIKPFDYDKLNNLLNAKTLNVKSVFAMCDKCVLIDKHDMCILNYVAKPIKRTVASESNKKPRNFTRKLYERVSKICSWWYSKFTPSGYKWKPKSIKENVNSNVIEVVLFIVDSGCSKHMMGNLKLLINFVEKFLGTVKFGNDQIVPILGYGDLRNDLLTCSRGMDLYSITLQNTNSPNLICLMAKVSSSQAWLWHRRMSYLNFDTINLLSKNDIVVSLPKLKFVKDHLCSSCELGKAKRKSFHTKLTPSLKRRSQLLHMDLCGPMRVASINGKVLIDFLRLVQRGLQAQVRVVGTDKGMEFLNQTLHTYFAAEGIHHQTSVARTPEQNGVLERRNRTLVEATKIMLSTAKVPLFFWAEAIATACFTQNQTYAENDQVADDEFINIFSTPVQDQGETSSRHVNSSNMHIFYERYPSEHHWIKDHPLEQVIGNPSQSIRTRRQLESDIEMCMFALTSQELKTVSYHKLYDILKQHQHEVNEIRAEKNSSTRSQQAATRNKGKAIVNSPQPIYDQEPSMVDEDDETSKDKEIDKLMALISLSFKKIYKPINNNLRTSSNTSRVNQDNSPRINKNAGYENQRIGNVAGARE
nr:hypothetical protein [Tanacetum cinerariifolium]